MGFFSLLGQKNQEQDQQTDTNYSLFLSKNEEIYNNGFELWKHCHQSHLQKLQHYNIQEVGFSIRPSSSSSQNNNINGRISNIDDEPSSYRYKSAELGLKMMNQGRKDGVNCQDCGNQAKKDCEHMRCRTCCKSQGFPCQTHMKSTWVPAAKRRDRQQRQSTQQLQTIKGENLKRMRETRGGRGIGGDGSGNGGGFELGRFPSEVISPAVFRCVKVSAAGDAEETLAYQTAVNIGGHVYKGILYDQGPESRYHGDGGGVQQHQLDMTGPPTSATTTSNSINFSMLEPSIYPTQYSGFLRDSQFFPPPKP